MITGNKKKLEEFLTIMTGKLADSYEIVSQAVDLPEIQGRPEEIAREKVKAASRLINGPALVEDVALYFHALNGLPGAYIKDFLNCLGCEGLSEILRPFGTKDAVA